MRHPEPGGDRLGNASAAVNEQWDSAHKPITDPPWMSRPDRIRKALMTVSKKA